MPAVTRKAPPHIAVASQPATGSPNRRPNSTSRTKPASGRAGISQTTSITAPSASEQRHVVGGGSWPPPQDRHDDAEAHHDLGGGHDEHEEHDRLAGHVVERRRERHEAQVHRVQHELDAHEHHERVAPHEQADGADCEQSGTEQQVPRGRHLEGGDHRRAPTSVDGWSCRPTSTSSPRAAGGRRASTTVPTTAMTSSTEVSSKANT